MRDEIERALEKENLDREGGTGDDNSPGVSYSATLLHDLDQLEKRTLGLREDILRNKEGQAWGAVETNRTALEDCFRSVPAPVAVPRHAG